MSTSIPLSSRNSPSSDALIASTICSCLVSRSTLSPLATRSWGEWSVSTSHSCPSSTAVSTISSMGLPPSDQFECEWQSPLRSANSFSPPLTSGFALSCNDFRYAGSSPSRASLTTAAVDFPMPGRSCRVPVSCRARQLVGRRLPDGHHRLAERLDAIRPGALALQQERDPAQRLVGLDGCRERLDRRDHQRATLTTRCAAAGPRRSPRCSGCPRPRARRTPRWCAHRHT